MKKIFYLLGLFLLLIPFKVNAVTIGAPSNVTIRADGQFRSEGTSYTSGAWGLSGYATDWLSNGGGAPTINSIWFHYPNLHQCANEDAIVKGKFFTTTNTGHQIFRDVILQYEDSQTGTYSRCTVYPDQSRGSDVVDFVCSGINAYSGNFVLSYLSQVPNDTASMFQVAISNNLEVTCSPNAGTVINNQNQNTQDIINNQNSKTNEIKDSIGSMGSSINSNIDGMKEKQDETNQQLGDLNNNITNDNVDDANSSANNFFTGFESEDYGLTAIVTAPLNFIKSITSATCTPVGFPLPFVDKRVELPCMKAIYQEHFGSFLTLYQTITFGIVAYWVCVNTLATVRGFKDPDSDRIEVLDL